jgi:drug/metabolite transporter (DMT)-like permease
MHVLVEEIAVTEVVAGRLLLGALTVFAIMAVMRRSPHIDVGVLPGAALLVVLDSVIPHTLIARAELSIDSGAAAVLISTMPMFTVAFAAVALPDDRPSTSGVVGLAVGFLGVIVLTSGDIFR